MGSEDNDDTTEPMEVDHMRHPYHGTSSSSSEFIELTFYSSYKRRLRRQRKERTLTPTRSSNTPSLDMSLLESSGVYQILEGITFVTLYIYIFVCLHFLSHFCFFTGAVKSKSGEKKPFLITVLVVLCFLFESCIHNRFLK